MNKYQDDHNDATVLKRLAAKSQWKRIGALEALQAQDHVLALLAARAHAADSSPNVRRVAIDLIRDLGSPSDCYRLLLASYDRSWQVRSSVADAWAAIGVPATVDRLTEMLMSDPHWVVRRDAAIAVTSVTGISESILRRAIKIEKNVIVKNQINICLYSRGDHDALLTVLQTLSDASLIECSNIVNGLADVVIRDSDVPTVAAALESVLQHPPIEGVPGDLEVFLSKLKGETT